MKGISGAITPSGALSTIKKILTSISGALTPSGSVNRKTSISVGVGTAGSTTIILRPNATGDLTELTPFPNTGESNYEDVDEVTKDDDTTYVEYTETGTTKSDLYQLSDYNGIGIITSVKICFYAREVDGSGLFDPIYNSIVKTHGVVDNFSVGVFPYTSYTLYEEVYAGGANINPATSAPWTWDEINDLQAGIKIATQANSKSARVTQLWVEVEYTSGVYPSGSLNRKTIKTVSGAITPAGTVSSIKRFLLSVAGAITPTGAVSTIKKIFLSIAGAVTPTSTLNRLIKISKSGSLTPSGTVNRKTKISISGGLSAAGSLGRKIKLTLSGAILPSGAISTIRKIFVSISGAITPSGALSTIKKIFVSVSGSITPTGTVNGIKRFLQSVSGAITPVGTIGKKIKLTVSGVLTPIGSLAAPQLLWVTLKIKNLFKSDVEIDNTLSTDVIIKNRFAGDVEIENDIDTDVKITNKFDTDVTITNTFGRV
jgi:hypothetical protein